MISKQTIDEDLYKKVIIKYDEKLTCRYSLKGYNKYPFLKYIITKEKFIKIIDKANIIISDAKMRKSKYDKVEISKAIYGLFLLTFIFTIIYIFLFYYSPRAERNQNKLKIFGIIFFCIPVAILSFMASSNFRRAITGDRPLIEFYKLEMINYIRNLNQQYKDKLIFNLDENTKDIICNVKVDENYSKNSENDSIIKNNNEDADSSSIPSQKSSMNCLYSDKNSSNK